MFCIEEASNFRTKVRADHRATSLMRRWRKSRNGVLGGPPHHVDRELHVFAAVARAYGLPEAGMFRTSAAVARAVAPRIRAVEFCDSAAVGRDASPSWSAISRREFEIRWLGAWLLDSSRAMFDVWWVLIRAYYCSVPHPGLRPRHRSLRTEFRAYFSSARVDKRYKLGAVPAGLNHSCGCTA